VNTPSGSCSRIGGTPKQGKSCSQTSCP
jgi:hypothetical protein